MKRSVTNRSTRMSFTDATSTWHNPLTQIGEGQNEKDRVLDEAYVEYQRLRDEGKTVHASLFCERYPTYRKSLRRLIDVDEAIRESGWDEVCWPECDTVFLGFVVHLELGVGAIARVYLASEVALGRRLVALKVSQYGSDEAETLGKLNHANVVPVHSVKTDDETGMTAVCMPYLGSATLGDVLEQVFPNKRQPLPAKEPPPASQESPQLPPAELPQRAEQILQAVRQREALPNLLNGPYSEAPDKVLVRGDYIDGVVHLAQQLAQGLAYTHSKGVLHRDLKPSNVLVTPSGRPMLLDFNLSCDEELNVNRMGGTLPYMAPEQIEAVFPESGKAEKPADVRSDIFSLGIILYEMLTGKLPFGEPPDDTAPRKAAANYLEAQHKPLTPIVQLNPTVGRHVARTVERCLELDARQRPQTADELARELQLHFAPRQHLSRFIYRHRAAVATLLVLACLASALGIWYLAVRPPYDVREYRRGVTHYRMTRYDKAVQHFDRAAEANANFSRAIFGRGVARMRQGDYAYAGQLLESAAERLDSATVYECLGYAKLMSEDPHPAGFAYSEARARSPQDLRLYLCQAFCSLNTPEAEPLLSTAIELGEESQAAYFLRAQARVRVIETSAGNMPREDKRLVELVDQVLADLERALQLGPPERSLLIYTSQRYALAAVSRPDLQPQLQAVLERAVQADCGRRDLERGGYFSPYSEENWYQGLIAQCAPSAPAAVDYPFVTPPGDDAIDTVLTWE